MKTLIAWKPIGDENVASSRLRAYIPCRELAKQQYPIELYNPKNKENYKAIIFQKAYTKEDITLAKELKLNGCIIILDQCDNHFYNPNADPIMEERKNRLIQMTEIADVITASTKKIADLYPDKRTFIIDDFIESPALSPLLNLWYKWIYYSKKRKSNVTNLIWYGNAGSESPRFGIIDLGEILKSLENVNRKYPIQLTVVSNSEELYNRYIKDKVSFQVHYISWKKRSFPYILKQHDLCLIPVQKNPFTICKTNNRVVLPLLLGVPVVADPIPSYEEFAPFISFSDWEKNLMDFIENSTAQYAKVKKGQEFVKRKYSEEKIVARWKAVLNEATNLSHKIY